MTTQTITGDEAGAHKRPGAEMFRGARDRGAPTQARHGTPSIPAIALRSTAATTPETLTLRDYQERDLASIRAALRIHRSVLLVQPCGAGKGTLSSYIVQSATARGRRIIFLVNRRALVHDMSKRLDRLGIEHGVIMGDDARRRPRCLTHVASISTLYRRSVLSPADLLIIDEARFSVSNTWLRTVDRYPNAKVLGLDATPIRTDGRGLGEMFAAMVQGPSVMDLIGQGYLVPSVTFAGSAADTSGVKHTGGDFNEGALAEISNTPKLIGDIVENWKRLSAGRKTVAFGVNKSHAANIAEQFRCAGIQFAYVDDATPDKERQQIWDGLDYGDLVGVASVGVISYGWDHPIIQTVVQARSTESLSVHLQQIGRGSRPYPGKTELRVLDHAGNYQRHGFYEDSREWSLEGRALGISDGQAISRIATCRVCFSCFHPGPAKCPFCGSAIEREERAVEVAEGVLEEVKPRMVCDCCKREMDGAKLGDSCAAGAKAYGACPGSARRAYQIAELSKNKTIAALQQTAQERGYKPGRLHHQIQRLGMRGGAK